MRDTLQRELEELVKQVEADSQKVIRWGSREFDLYHKKLDRISELRRMLRIDPEGLTPAQAIALLQEQGYPLPTNPISARTHLLRLGDRGLVAFTTTAGGHRRYREADLLEFLNPKTVAPQCNGP